MKSSNNNVLAAFAIVLILALTMSNRLASREREIRRLQDRLADMEANVEDCYAVGRDTTDIAYECVDLLRACDAGRTAP